MTEVKAGLLQAQPEISLLEIMLEYWSMALTGLVAPVAAIWRILPLQKGSVLGCRIRINRVIAVSDHCSVVESVTDSVNSLTLRKP